MTSIQFIGDDTKYPVESVINTSAHIKTIIGDFPPMTSGFNILMDKGLWKKRSYPDYTTVYRILPDGVQYSDNGTIYAVENAEKVEEDEVTE